MSTCLDSIFLCFYDIWLFHNKTECLCLHVSTTLVSMTVDHLIRFVYITNIYKCQH